MNIEQLGNLCLKIGSGATPRGGEKVYQREGVALIRSQNVRSDGFTRQGLVYIDAVHADQLANVAVAARDVLLNITGESVARVCQVPNEVLPARVNQHVAIIRAHPDRLDAGYLRYALSSPDMQARLHALASAGATRRALTKNMISSLAVKLPVLAEQRAIADVLGALDDKIELNRRMNETLEALARQFHTEAIRGAGSRTLGELVLINARKRSRDFEHEEIEYVDISSVKEGRLDVPAPLRIEEAPSRAQRLVADGDTIWSCVRPNRRSYAFIDNPPANRVVSTGFAVLTPQVVPPGFLYLAVTTNHFVDYLSANADGSAYPAVRPEHFERAEIPVPDEDALRSFETMVRPLLARIAHNNRESETLAELRDALLPKLISGELRVQHVEKTF